MPRIVCISDTHLFHLEPKAEDPPIPDGDILIHAGDGTYAGSVKQTQLFLDWLASLPHRRKVFIAGNHDWIFQNKPVWARSMIPESLIYLEDSMTEVDGLKIYGSPWQPEFLNWAFNLPRGHCLREKWERIPAGLDILVTHGPPSGVLDLTYDGRHVGCADLKDVLMSVKPKLHVFGHIHYSHGIVKLEEPPTVFVNASLLDDAYRYVFPPIVVDL